MTPDVKQIQYEKTLDYLRLRTLDKRRNHSGWSARSFRMYKGLSLIQPLFTISFSYLITTIYGMNTWAHQC